MLNDRPYVHINGTTLFMDMIYCLYPLKRSVCIRHHKSYEHLAEKAPHMQNIKHGLIFFKVNETLFNRIKFEYIKHIKALPLLEDRVAGFEWRDEKGVPDFEKMERLIEMRKTRDERAIELKEEIEMKELCHKHKIKYFGPLSGL